MDDSNNGDDLPARNRAISLDMRDSLILATKLIAVIIVVTILSIGLVGCCAFFLYLCFKFPASAGSFLQLLIPAGVGGLVIRYGKKALLMLTKKNDTK